MNCINLKERYGDKYRVRHEDWTWGRKSHISSDPWEMVILCKYGHVCPWGGNDLAACTDRSGRIAAQLKRLPFVEVWQDGSDGANVVFDASTLGEVMRIMRPRLRRRLSPEQRAIATARLQALRGSFVLRPPGEPLVAQG